MEYGCDSLDEHNARSHYPVGLDFKEKCISDVVRVGNIIILHLSKL